MEEPLFTDKMPVSSSRFDMIAYFLGVTNDFPITLQQLFLPNSIKERKKEIKERVELAHLF